MAELELQPLPPAEAVEFFRGKGLQESFAWQDVMDEEHAKAFTVAKAMRRDVLYDIRGALDAALSEGRTFGQFKDELRPLLMAKGWWGRAPMTDPATGEEREVQLGSTRRLRTIFDVNLRSAYQAGRWQRIQETKGALPFLRYVAVQDGRTRPEHLAWHGTILPVDDPWWDTHYPPCGFNCRCTVVQINQRTMDRRGWTVTEEPIRFQPVPYENPRTGEVTVLERGVDPGFNFNVGKAWLDGVTPRAGSELPDVARLVSGGTPPIEPRPGPGPIEGDLVAASEAFLGRFGVEPGGAAVFTDAGGEPFAVSPALFTSASGAARLASRAKGLPMAAEAIADPDEIRWVWDEGEKPVRRYIRRIKGKAGTVDVIVDAAVGGSGPSWSFRTSLDGELDLDAHRGGVLSWRRPTE